MILPWVAVASTGCGSNEAAALAQALSSGECGGLARPESRDACYLEQLACEQVADATQRSECAFRMAEKSGNMAYCAAAGPFVDDCRMHLWSASFPSFEADPVVGRDEAEVGRQLAKSGFDPLDPRPWSAWFRYALGSKLPMDRGACRTVVLPLAQEACLATGLSLYGDRLNAARDRGTYPCDGGELPAFLQTTPDPEIEALRASRTDLCP